MKKLIITSLTLFVSLMTFGQGNLDKYGDMKGVTSLEMTANMFKLLSKIDLNSSDPEMQDYIKLVENLDDIKMYTTTQDDLASQLRTDVTTYLGTANLEELMRVRDDGKNVNFYYKPGTNDEYVREFLMLVDGDLDGEERTVVIRITGDISLAQISKLANKINFPGGKELEKADQTN